MSLERSTLVSDLTKRSDISDDTEHKSNNSVRSADSSDSADVSDSTDASDIMEDIEYIKSTLAIYDIKGTMLYPMSGADITPLLLFPDLDTIVMIDEHPLHDHTYELLYASDRDMIMGVRTAIEDIEGKNTMPLTIQNGGFDWTMSGADCNDPIFMLKRYRCIKQEIPSTSRLGLIHILITRIEDHTRYVVQSITEVQEHVHRIELIGTNLNKKEIYYVQKKLGQVREYDRLIDWLSKFQYSSAIFKGYVNTLPMIYEPDEEAAKRFDAINRDVRRILHKSVKRNANFKVMTERRPDHISMISSIMNANTKSIVGPIVEPIECLDIKFGFSNLLYIYDGSAIENMHRYDRDRVSTPFVKKDVHVTKSRY